MDKLKEGYNYSNVSKDFYGKIPHGRAIKIANYEFFWDSVDEIAPFGTDESYLAFEELCDWIDENPDLPIKDCFQWILACWDYKLENFNEDVIETENILKIIQDFDFDEELMMLDITLISTGFGQLILQGRIDHDVKNIIQLAILRQMNSHVLDSFLGDNESWKFERYCYLQKLLEILEIA